MLLTDFLHLSPALTKYTVPPWQVPGHLAGWIEEYLGTAPEGYTIRNGAAIHSSARVEGNVTFHGPVCIGPNCYVKANAYFRGGVYLDEGVTIGPGCEIKSSYIGRATAIAHLNYVGNSLIGAEVNFEAGAIAANHYNERTDKEITLLVDGLPRATGLTKFGAVVGDGSRIGANAVLSPGTILPPGSVVGRLELVRQG